MRRQLFSLVVLVTLGLVAFVGVVLVRPELIGALTGRETTGHISHHFREYEHRVHDLTFAFLMGTAVLGTLTQLRRPTENAATQLMALLPIAALALAATLSTTAVLSFPWVSVGALICAATVLHPRTRELLRSVRAAQADRVMLVLVAMATPPLVAFAYANLDLQRRGLAEHAALGHYGYMAAWSFTVIGLGLLTSLRPKGWRLLAWVTGLLAASLGLSSLVFPDVESSLGPFWAIATIAWGVAFAARSEFARRARSVTT